MNICLFSLVKKFQWIGLPSEVEAEPPWPVLSALCPRQQQAASILTFCPRIPSLFLCRQTHAAMSVTINNDRVITAVTPSTMTSGNSGVRSFTVEDGTKDENKPWGKRKQKNVNKQKCKQTHVVSYRVAAFSRRFFSSRNRILEQH